MKKILVLFIAMLVVFAATGCGKEPQEDLDLSGEKPEKAVVVDFWMYGDDVELGVYRKLVQEFNKKYEGYVYVNLRHKAPNDYTQGLMQVLNGKSGPDVFYVEEIGFKAMAEAGYLLDITSYVEQSTEYDVTKMWESATTRFQYDVNTKTVNGPDKKYYAVPKDIGPTVIYYNETMFKAAGINVISVSKEDLADFNNNGKADSRGKTKAQYGITVEVKEKGYFEANGKKWFNNQIAMNWEETVAISNQIQSVHKGSNGYFTEWWFNYGWSVGGDCIQYIPTDDSNYLGGYWDFTLMDDTPNYIVADDAEPFTINGNTYQPGEIISYNDKLSNEDAGGPGQTYTVEKIVEAAVKTACAAGQLNQLPSQRYAFVEFVRLAAPTNKLIYTTEDGEKLYGHGITPSPSAIGGDSGKTNAFINGDVAMLVDGRWNVTNFRKEMVDEWDVAPLPVYKEYDSEGNVMVHGVTAGHSGSIGVAINKKCSVPNAAWLFLEFIGGEYGQAEQSKTGFAIPLQKELALNEEIFLQTDKSPRNSIIFLEAAEAQKAGDWWYLKDNKWIDPWASILNGSVRNGKSDLNQFKDAKEFLNTYKTLLSYTKK